METATTRNTTAQVTSTKMTVLSGTGKDEDDDDEGDPSEFPPAPDIEPPGGPGPACTPEITSSASSIV